MEIIGDRIKIKPLEIEDVYRMKSWGEHENPLLDDYNFPYMNNFQIKRWYNLKTKSFFNKYFAVYTKDGSMIGYMGIKFIKYIIRESTLGIVFDPNYLNMGYGTEALKYFLKEYFTSMNMKVMYLEVSKFNHRAYRVYEKMGFKEVAYYLERFSDGYVDKDSPYFKKHESSFVISDGEVYNYIYKMKLEKEVFLRKYGEIQ